MAGVIDADTHIAEPEAMWKFFDEDMYPRRPVLTSITDDTLYGTRNKFWLIDGNIFPKPSGKGGFRLVTPAASTWKRNGTTASWPAARSPTSTCGSRTWTAWESRPR